MDTTSGSSTEQRTIEGYREVQTVWCPPMKKMVSLRFCLTGGPHRSEGLCEHFRDIKTQNKRTVLTHVIPMESQEIVTTSVVEEDDDGTDIHLQHDNSRAD